MRSMPKKFIHYEPKQPNNGIPDQPLYNVQLRGQVGKILAANCSYDSNRQNQVNIIIVVITTRSGL